MKIPIPLSRIICLVCLVAVIALAVIASHPTSPAIRYGTAPRGTMVRLDAQAQPFIQQAKAAVPYVVQELCRHRGRLYRLLLKDKCTHRTDAANYIASVVTPKIVAPLSKAAGIYGCSSLDLSPVWITQRKSSLWSTAAWRKGTSFPMKIAKACWNSSILSRRSPPWMRYCWISSEQRITWFPAESPIEAWDATRLTASITEDAKQAIFCRQVRNSRHALK